MNGSLPSRLTGFLRGLLAGVVVLAALTLADTAYLLLVRLAENVAPAEAGTGAAATRLFQALLLAHSALGIALVFLAIVFSALHLQRVWTRRNPAVVATGVATVTAGVVLLATGVFILGRGAGAGHGWIWWVHVVIGIAVPGFYVLHRRRSVVRIQPAAGRRFAGAVAVVTLLFGLSHAVTRGPASTNDATRPGRGRPSADDVARDLYGAVPPGFASPHSAFYPSPVTTGSGGVMSSDAILGPLSPGAAEVGREVATRGYYARAGIGAETCVRCHPDVTRQWETSAHRFSSFNNPFYEASIDRLRSIDVSTGVRKSRWCGACHDPALLFTGALDGEVQRGSPEAQAGLTCLACHAIQDVHDRTGNGNYSVRDGTPSAYIFSDAIRPGLRRGLHDLAVRARPEAHRAAMLPELLKQADGCGSCHKVSLREPVNDYRWLRGQDEFDAWEESGVSLEGAQTFYLPAERRICQDCHMPPEPAPLGDLAADGGVVRSHRFGAANTALPYIRGDSATLRRIEEFLAAEIVSLDIFAYRSAAGPESAMALAESGAFVPGSEIIFDVVVRNRGVGHAFPGGTIDSNESWLDVRLVDSLGTVVAASGELDEAGRVDDRAHVFRALFVDSAGGPIDRRNPQDIRATVFRNVIDPGTANLAHYRVKVPASPGAFTFDVKLQWRKFDPDYTAFVFTSVPEAFPGLTAPPRLPITTLARAQFSMLVQGSAPVPGSAADTVGAASPDAAGDAAAAKPSAWLRWNDYGIASLREGSTRAAATAFGFVSSLEPARPDGPMNLARVALADGEVEAALRHLEEAERRAPGDARIAWLRAEAELADGSYDLAIGDYEATLAEFPRHRRSLLGLGRALYLDGRYEEALAQLDALLAIDPESLPALYHRMLVLRSLGRREEAAEAEALVEYFEVDETAGRLTRAIRAARPGVNAMAQAVRTHDLIPVGP